MKSKFLLSIMAIALIFVASACSFSSNDGEKDAEIKAQEDISKPGMYKHANFTLDYPEDWETQENVYGTLVAILSPVVSDEDIFSENCNVVLDDSVEASTYSVKDYFDASVGQLASFITGYEELDRATIQMGDKEAYYIAYSGLQGEYTLTWIQYLSKGEKNHYILTCTAMSDSFDEYKSIFDDIAKKMTVK